MSRGIGVLILCLLLMAAFAHAAPSASAASISGIQISADPTEDEPVTVTVSGTTEASRKLYVYWTYWDCAAVPGQNSGTLPMTPSGLDVPIAAGSFSKSFTVTPSQADNYKVCAYVASSEYTTPLASAESVVNVRFPQASVGQITVSADPTEDEPVTVTVSGTTEASRKLYVYWTYWDCAAVPGQNSGTLPMTPSGLDVPIAAGSFSKSFTVTPSQADNYKVCAYVASSEYTTPLASAESVVNVRFPQASVGQITVSADPTEDEPVTVTVSGTTEASRKLYVYWTYWDCAAVPGQNSGTLPMTPSGLDVPIAAGSFSKSFTVTPSQADNYKVCAYVASSEYTTPLAKQAKAVVTRRPQATITFAAPPSYLRGETVTVNFGGEAEHAAYFESDWSDGDGPCSSDPLRSPPESNLPQGTFSRSATTTAGTASAMTLCVRVFDLAGGPPIATARLVVQKKPIEVPTGLRSEVSEDRRPTLSWKTPTVGTDSVVLIEGGEPTTRITQAGAVPYTVPDFIEGQGGLDEPSPEAPDPSVGKVVRRSDGTTSAGVPSRSAPWAVRLAS